MDNLHFAQIRAIIFPAIIAIVLAGDLFAQAKSAHETINEYVSFNGDSKIECGGYYAGLAFHHSRPVPQRVSFYYPAANSIDLSTDYWHRDTTRVMNAAVQFGSLPVELLDDKSLPYKLTPYSVEFTDSNYAYSVSVAYHFVNRKPGPVIIYYTIKNNEHTVRPVSLFLNYAASLRTSHTFALKDKPVFSKDINGRLLTAAYDDIALRQSELYLYLSDDNTYSYRFSSDFCPDTSSNKKTNDNFFDDKTMVQGPLFKLHISFDLKPEAAITIPVLLGCCELNGSRTYCEKLTCSVINKLVNESELEIRIAAGRGTVRSGDAWLDRSARWAKEILEANHHYIDGDIVPMPCPAEYNFFFTHDVLLTDQAAVKFDLPRVKRDLQFILKHSSAEGIIPHAFYWKDSCFKTEPADNDNWNNFWFTITAAEYLKYSDDTAFARILYPVVRNSLFRALKTKGDDDLMWSYRPDWWDIGHLYGQRSYMTILAVKALRSYVYFASILTRNDDELAGLERLAERMKTKLNERLWFSGDKYLMNFTLPGVKDEHFYCGSLLALHYGLLEPEQVEQAIEGAARLVEPNTGVFVAYPMDFDELSKFWNFAGDEAGGKFFYMNGGIWPHANAWYALALISAGMRDSALSFIRRIMTLDGIMNSPNGQPAMYEVRNGNAADPRVYGTVDKPQFTWAGGWYLYALYYLYAITDNEWNLTFTPWLKHGQQEMELELNTCGTKSDIKISRQKELSLSVDGRCFHSLVLPADVKQKSKINVDLGPVNTPVLSNTTSTLRSIVFSGSKMLISLYAFAGHANTTTIYSPRKPKCVKISGRQIEPVLTSENGFIKTEIRFIHSKPDEKIDILF